MSGPAPGAARIVDRGYQHYTGRRLGGGHAFWTMVRGALDRALGRRRKISFATVLKYLAVLFANAPIVFTLAMQTATGDHNFSYPNYLSAISLLSILFAALVAPDLLCPDRRERVLSLYFAAPITRLQYLLANAAALTALMLAITLLPLLAYFVGSTVLSGSALGYAGDHTDDLWHLLIGGTLAAGYYVALALLAAGFNDRRSYAAGAFLGTLLVSTAAAAILSQGMRFGGHERFALLDLLQLPIRVTRWLFGMPPEVTIPNRNPPYFPTVDGWAYLGLSLALISISIGAVLWQYLRGAGLMGAGTVHATYPPARPEAEPVDPKSGATIEARGVSKWFGEKVAVSDLSFFIGPGVTALLGPNGAGKSTTLKLLTGQIRPSQGTLRVLGQPVADNPPLYRRIGLVPEQEGVYPFLSALEFVELAARLQRVPKPREAARQALRLVELEAVAGRAVGGFSKGMRQRVKIAQALVHGPEVLFLDEPLTGADPRQRLALMEIFGVLAGQGKTLLVSSHILNEVERIATNVLVIVNGKLAAEGDFHAIRGLMEDRPRRVQVSCSDPRALGAELIRLPGTRSVALEGERLTVETAQAIELYRLLPQVARRAAIRLTGIEGLDEDLDSVFRYLVSR